jgi:hypothetical protein
MDEQVKRRRIRNYFKPFPSWAIVLIVFGVLLLAAYGAGIVLIGFGILGIVLYGKDRATDQEMDQWLEESRKTVEKTALNRLGTVEEEAIKDPLTIYKPVFWTVPGILPTEVMRKKGKDGFWRFSIWSVAIFHLTDKYMGCFRATFNFLNGNTANESTEEFFYKDIVKVGTAQDSLILKNGAKLTDAESFVLRVSSGDAVTVYDITQKLEKWGMKVIPTSPIEQTIQAIRTMLREKKA